MKVLFLCMLNTVRSPIAEAIARAKFPQHSYQSAGFIESPLDYMAVEVMKEIDLDISTHIPTSLDKIDLKDYDLVLCLAEEIRDKLQGFNVPNVEYWDITSPASIRGSRFQKLLSYRELRDDIKKLVEERFSK
jgi:protein-tyrosine-phosphatase